MILHKIISENTILLDISDMDKWNVIEALMDRIMQTGQCRDRQAVVSAVVDREKRCSTGLVNGVAIPHARSEMVGEMIGALGISKKGIDFESADGKPCHLVFLIIAPHSESTRYLKALSEVAFIGSEPKCVATIRSSATRKEVLSILADKGRDRSESGATGMTMK